jgi:transketolase
VNYEEKLLELMSLDTRLFVLTSENRGPVVSVAERFPDRFCDVGICEQTMVGIAAGMSKFCGLITIVHAMASFLTMRAYEFIRTDIGIHRLPVKIVGSSPGIYSEFNGPTHQAIEDVALMHTIPSMNIFVPADMNELVLGMEKIISSEEPWYIRYNNFKGENGHTDFQIGKAEVIGIGDEVAILTYGAMFENSLKLLNLLSDHGIFGKVLNMRCLSPIDENAIVTAAIECGRLVVIEDHFKFGGLYTLISEILIKNKIVASVDSFCFLDYFKAGSATDIISYYGLSYKKIFEAIYGDV